MTANVTVTTSKRERMVRAAGLAAAVVALFCSGCVQRRMTIRSNPPGAYVYVDNYPIGVTPVSTDFVYYGKRQFRLVRDGYETLTVEQKVPTPWYEWFGLDFVSENLVPYNIRDEQNFNFQMVPQQIPPNPQLLANAQQLRSSAQAQRYVAPMELPQLPPSTAAPVQPLPAPGTRVPPPGTGQPTYVMPPPGPAPGTQSPLPGWVPAPGGGPRAPVQPGAFVPPRTP